MWERLCGRTERGCLRGRMEGRGSFLQGEAVGAKGSEDTEEAEGGPDKDVRVRMRDEA